MSLLDRRPKWRLTGVLQAWKSTKDYRRYLYHSRDLVPQELRETQVGSIAVEGRVAGHSRPVRHSHSPLPVLPEPPNFKTNCRAGLFFSMKMSRHNPNSEKHSASQIKHTNRTSMVCRPWLWLLCNIPNTYPDPGPPRSWQEASPFPHTALPSYHRLGTQPSPGLSPHSDDPHCV